MPCVATLDACVLYPMPLCDSLLRLASAQFFRPVWSSQILDELVNVFLRKGRPLDAAIRRRQQMVEAFPDAQYPYREFMSVVPLDVDEGDRHVVAAALASRPDIIVTDNVRHFAISILETMGIAVLTPSEFLIQQMNLNELRFRDVLDSQGAALRPSLNISELLSRFVNYQSFASEAHVRFCGGQLPNSPGTTRKE